MDVVLSHGLNDDDDDILVPFPWLRGLRQTVNSNKQAVYIWYLCMPCAIKILVLCFELILDMAVFLSLLRKEFSARIWN